MCLLIFEIVMLLAGLIFLISGKILFLKRSPLEQKRVRIAGAILMLPLPAAFSLGLLFGYLIVTGILPVEAGLVVDWIVELLIIATGLAAAVLVVYRPERKTWVNIGFQAGALVLAALIITGLLIAAGAPPLRAYWSMLKGAFGSWDSVVTILISWAPLLLTTAGVLITFSAGLWNIGVEGQMTLGAISTTGMMLLLQDTALPPALIIILGILAGIIGGALWASLAGGLKIFGGVNEIFGGLGLNFVATALTIYLVFGPWSRPGVASMSGTKPFARELWLPTLPGTDLSFWALGLSILVIAGVYLLLRGTHFGLRLKAVGKNPKAAFLMGVPTWQYSMFAFLLCGAMAGLAGALQVVGLRHNLLPNISNGYGFLGLLVAMLVNYQAIWAIPVAFFFAALNTGSVQLQINYKMDSSFAGVLQSLLVLLVLLGEGARQRFVKKNVER